MFYCDVSFRTALDWARHFRQPEAVDLLESHMWALRSLHHEDVRSLRSCLCVTVRCVCLYRWCVESGQLDESSLVQTAASELSSEDQELLKAYHHSFDDEKVDLDLILHLLFNICQSSDEGETVTQADAHICSRPYSFHLTVFHPQARCWYSCPATMR